MIQFYTNEALQKFYESDAEFIGVAFLISETTGITSVEMAIKKFQNLLFQRKKNCILSMDIEYKIYILGLLNSIIERVDNEYYQYLVTNHIIEFI